MSSYDTYGKDNIQLKTGPCKLNHYNEGDKVDIPDNIYIAIEGFVVIYEGKLLNYVDHQVGVHRQQSPIDGSKMVKLARFIELNSSEYYKTKGLRHGKKKVRNVRD